jgi:predicted metalloprotease with PDZ domain
MPVQLIGRDQEADARAEALRQAGTIGAERVLLAAPRDVEGAAWIADYYVRFKLPFGATFRDLRAQERATLAADGGVAIGTVIGGTPASRANLIPGDYVLAVDGKPIVDRADFQDRLKRSAGHAVTLTVIRNGEALQRVVKLGAVSDGKD